MAKLPRTDSKHKASVQRLRLKEYEKDLAAVRYVEALKVFFPCLVVIGYEDLREPEKQESLF